MKKIRNGYITLLEGNIKKINTNDNELEKYVIKGKR